MGKNCKIYKRICLNLALCVGFAFGDMSHNGVLSESVINLSSGETRTDSAISIKGNGTMSTFNYLSSTNLSVQGAQNATYQLENTDKTTTFYANAVSVGAGINANFTGFHTINFQTTLNLGANSSMTITNATSPIDASASEFGGFPKVRFHDNSTTLKLGVNSSLTVANTYFFIHKGDVSLQSGAKLDITALGIRFEKSFTNDGANVNLNTGTNEKVKVGVYNVANDGVAVFTQNSGTIVVNGDFYNGGNVLNDTSGSVIGFNSYDPAVTGGGELVLNGGEMRVSGKFISQSGGLQSVQNSVIKLYGATLIVGGGLSNLQGSTLIFGIGNNDKMGLLQGNLSQNSGSVKLDINKMRANTKYTIISGSTPSGFGAANITLIGSNADLWNLSYENGVVSISTSGFDFYKASLNTNEKALLNAMSAAFGGDDVLLSEIEDLKSAVAETEQTLKNSYIAQPKRMINAFKSDLLHAPMRVSVASRRLAASGFVRLDSGKRVSPFVVKTKRDFFISPMVSAFEDDGVDGNLYGFTLGASWASEKALNRVHFSYALGKSTQNLSTQSTDTRANLFELGAINRYKMGFWESEISANAVFSGFEVDNFWHQQTLNSSSKFNNYQANLGVNLGPRLGEKLSFKPFLGLSNYFEHQDAFKMGFGLSADGYNAYILDAVLGFETHYIFSEFASVFARVGFEKRLYNSHKLAFIRSDVGELTYENESYDNVLSVNLGTQLLSYNALNVDVEGFFKRYDTALIHYGGNLVLRWRF